MKTIQIPNAGHADVVHTELPSLQPHEVLLSVHYVGFCGSDLNTFLGRNSMVKYPVTPGHEISAVIQSTGNDVPSHLYHGRSVTVNPYTHCGRCAACRARRYNACQYNETLGVQRNGAMSEYLIVPWEKIIPTDGIPAPNAALIEPMSVGFHAVSRGQVTDSDVVVVIGCGMVGMGAIVRAALRGATVVAIDVSDEKLSLASAIGAHHVINSNTSDVVTAIMQITDGLGADVVIEAVGNAATYRLSVDIVSFCGRIVFIGYAPSEVSFSTKLFVQKELTIRGSRNALPEDFRAVIRYMHSHPDFPADQFISRIVSPSQALETLNGWATAPQKIFRILVNFR